MSRNVDQIYTPSTMFDPFSPWLDEPAIFAAMPISSQTSLHTDAKKQQPLTGYSKLPHEIKELIIDKLQPDRRTSKSVLDSILSLVCWSWSWKFRPRLYELLKLHSIDDCRTLATILRSPTSRWLRNHVYIIELQPVCLPHSRAWVPLLQQLPFLHKITAASISGRDGVQPHLFMRCAHIKSAWRSLRALTLESIRFPSFSSLLRTLGDMPFLEDISLCAVTWSNFISTTIHTTPCNAAFSHIRQLDVRFCTDNLAIPSYIFAAASTRYRYVRRATSPTGAQPLPNSVSMVLAFFRAISVSGPVDGCTFSRAMEHTGEEHFVKSGTWITLTSFVLVEAVIVTVASCTTHAAVKTDDFHPEVKSSTRAVSRFAIADAPTADPFRQDWRVFASVLLECVSLESFYVLCGHGYTSDNFVELSSSIYEALGNHPSLKLRHNSQARDGRSIEPEMFPSFKV